MNGRLITFDPTERTQQSLVVAGSRGEVLATHIWDDADSVAGSRLVELLASLAPSSADTLRVVRGPGHYTPLRIAATVANLVAALSGCQLQARTATETEWQCVSQIVPEYGAEPIITKSHA